MGVSRIVALSLAGVIVAGGAAAESIKIATWNIENLRIGSRTPDELAALRALVGILDADVIAVQEVDGPEADGMIFDPDEYDFHFSSRNDPQRTGFAIRQDVQFTAHPDLVELDIGKRSPRHRHRRDDRRAAASAPERPPEVVLP